MTKSAMLLHGMAANPSTWWRVGARLADLGWTVETPRLLGHGGRALGTARTVADLASDIAQRYPGGADLLVGHSLGAYVALELARGDAYARGVIVEDPPTVSAVLPAEVVAGAILDNVRSARSDPHAARARLRASNPTWDERDVDAVIEGRLQLDPGVASLSAADSLSDLLQLVDSARVPVALLAAVGEDSQLVEPARALLLAALPVGNVAELASGHALHRDRPAAWTQFVDAFGNSLL